MPPDLRQPARTSRRTRSSRPSRALALAAAGALALPLAACTSDPDPSPTGSPSTAAAATPGPRTYRTVDMQAPPLPMTHGPAAADADDADEGLYVLAPKKKAEPHLGGLMVDATGEPVWIDPGETPTYDLRVQEYQGKPVLTYFTGESEKWVGHGAGDIHVLDTSYREVAKVTTGGDLAPHTADLHDSTITPDGTMLLTSYPVVQTDLTAVGGDKDGYVFDGVVQEVDIATGTVLHEWSALDHVDLADTYASVEPAKEGGDPSGTKDAPFDFFHVNSARLTPDGDLLISSRQYHAAYAVDRESGDVRWTLGGKDSDFTMQGSGDGDEPGTGAQFAWQHDVEMHDDGTVTVFDNEGDPGVGDHSRGLRLALDMDTMTASVDQEWLPSDPKRRAGSQGNLQVLDDGNVVVGWGDAQWSSEYTADGTLVREFPLLGGETYRTYRFDWHATPTNPPAVVVEAGTAYASWNGATEVASWRLVAGDDESSAQPVATVPRAGFETALAPVPDGAAYVAVEALDADGKVLGTGTPAA
ncbi:arylsulfotransferase family protein [Cellulomonas sp. PhB143]|uniref:arylsulfotransferase family protein n=1 Tax=Cellulomonas sp. PhB143 TaxID=2485186 RepID=UPI000F4824D9|nr:arylsulfotransferase family protein [Cellulomonas sp. PhB143]ROS79079.1 arylsulfotransferase ASST [Cellulomonas sp. PhB143]